MSTVNHDGNDTNDYPTGHTRPTTPDLTRILGGRLRQAIGDPGNFVRLHEGELHDEWLTRAATVAIEMALFENDATLVTGKELFDREHRDARNDAGLLAFIVRDFMAAAGYHYQPDRPLTDQAQECDALIREHWTQMNRLNDQRMDRQREHDAERQRLTDLVAELRKQLEHALRLARDHGATVEPWDFSEPAAARFDAKTWAEYRSLDDAPAVAAWRAIPATMPTPAEWNAVVYERDGLRKIVMDKDQELEKLNDLVEASCPCQPDAPAHEHLTGGYAITPEDWQALAAALNSRLDPNVALSPDGMIWIKNSDGWCKFSPNGEYRESDYGDELTDDQVADWPKGRLPDRPAPPAVLGDVEVTTHD